MYQCGVLFTIGVFFCSIALAHDNNKVRKFEYTRLDGSVYTHYTGSSYWVEATASSDKSFKNIACRKSPPRIIEYTDLSGVTKRSIDGSLFFVVPTIEQGSVKRIEEVQDITSSNSLRINSVAPMPANSELLISYSSKSNSQVELKLLNNVGDVVFTTVQHGTVQTGAQKCTIHLSGIDSGMYTLVVDSGEGIATTSIAIIK